MHATPTSIELFAPEIRGQQVVFRWEVTPSGDLYGATRFTLSFPEPVDPARVPERLWWTLFLLCLHSHWTLLRPCRVRLPVKLAHGEVEGWYRLLDSYIPTVEHERGGGDYERKIEIIEGTTALAPAPRLADSGLAAAAFSGGKDSLVHAGLLAELTPRPILVTTTSPMPPLEDHVTPHRRRMLDTLRRRTDVTLVEVRSDFRASWNNLWPRNRGYRFSLNEISDAFLYTAALVAVSYALGASHTFLASENEVSHNEPHDGRLLQHRHFMYSGLTQAAIRAMLAPVGIYYGSLISALHSNQVQELLTRRYRDLGTLQLSCWRTSADRKACSECSECKRLTWAVLSFGGSPSHLGVDLVHLLNHHGPWKSRSGSGAGKRETPNSATSLRFREQAARAISATPFLRVLAHVALRQPETLFRADGWKALRAFHRVRRELLATVTHPLPHFGYRAGYLNSVDPALRDAVGSIYDQHFEREAESRYAEQLERLSAAVDWIAEPFRNGVG